MIGKCNVCNKVKDVEEVITARSFMEALTGLKHGKLLVCEECIPTVIEGVKQALNIVNKIIYGS